MRTNNLNLLWQILLLFIAVTTAIPTPEIPNVSLTKRASTFWMETIARNGAVAYGSDPSYKIFRNVKDYGATGDGNTDDTDAINKAILDGNRCGEGCDSSTTTPAIVYFPAGVYRISKPIVMYYYTQMIGDALSIPSIKGLSSFEGLAMLDADPYIPGGYGANWYTNQNNFYRQVRNLNIDMTDLPDATPEGGEMNGIHWQVAQAASMQNVVFNMKPPSSTNKQRGIMMENGSGMFMADITFNGGNVGAYLGAQQYTTRNFTFNNCNTAILMHWNWIWTMKSVKINNCQVGLNISSVSGDGTVTNGTVGSMVLMDSKIQAQIGVATTYGSAVPATAGTLYLQNIDFAGTPNAVVDRSGSTILQGNVKVAAWGQGNAYMPPSGSQQKRQAPVGSSQDVSATCDDMETATATETGVVSPIPATETETGVVSPIPATETETGVVSPIPATATATSVVSPVPGTSTVAPFPVANNTISANGTAPTRSPASQCTASAVLATATTVKQAMMNPPPMPSALTGLDGAVFERSKPQYEDVTVSSFVSIKSFGAKGDGVTDDTQAIQDAMNKVNPYQILYFDHGAYVITRTVDVPSNIRIVGEIWPLIMIGGEFFSDQNNPQPGFRVGKPGDTGVVEISDLIFETRGPAPGAIMMEWNVAQATQGSCAMWDTHFRVGGTAGTELQQDKCLAKTPDSKVFKPECAGSFMMMHITQTATAYLEGTWFWVADHELDMKGFNQTNIYNGRGVFVESQGPVWLMGTSSEHSQLYNYQISNAKNIWMGSIQTETAYMQSAPNALDGGFTPNAAYSDPDFSDCGDDNSCKKTWGLRVIDSSDIFMHGGGLYSFFDDYTQTCLDSEDCQLNMIDIECSTGVYLYGVVTKASSNQIIVNGQPAVFEKDNPNLFGATVLLYEQQ